MSVGVAASGGHARWWSQLTSLGPRFDRDRRVAWKPLAWVTSLLLLGSFLALLTAVQPLLTLLLLILLVILAALVGLWRGLAPGAPTWIKASLFVVCAQLVLAYGFSNIIFFAGGVPIPLTDTVMMVAMLCCAWKVWFARERVHLPLGLWLLLGWVVFNLAWHLPAGLIRDGVGAARDAMPTVQMVYVLAGFVISTLCLRAGSQGQRWVRSVLMLLAICLALYGLTYPVADGLRNVSPRVTSVQQSVPILGYHQTWPGMGVVSIIGLALWRWQAMRRGLGVSLGGRVAGALIVMSGLLTFFMIQARVAYVYVILCVPLFLLVGDQSKQALRIIGAVLLGLTVLFTVELSGAKLQGRVGQLTASGIYHHLMSLTGTVSETGSEFRGAAGGINQRKQWREYSLGLWRVSADTQLLGIGFGPILTDLTTGGTAGETLVVREPHNSYVTTLTRSGLLGLGVMLSLHGTVLYCSYFGYRRYRDTHPAPSAYLLGAFFFELFCLLNAWGEPHFEVAYWAVPSYFIAGSVLALYARLRALGATQRL